MKKYLFFFLFFSPLCFFSQNQKLRAFIESKSFHSPKDGSFIEFNFQFVGYTAHFQNVENGMYASIAISTKLINEKSDTVAVDQYILKSPVFRDSVLEDFYSVQRIAAPSGKYRAIIEMLDLNSNQPSIAGEIQLEIADFSEVSVSDILIAEQASPSYTVNEFYKSGYEIIPRISNYYGVESRRLPLYVEIYNTNKMVDSAFGIKQIILDKDNVEVPGYSKFLKSKREEVIPFFRNIDISKLASGTYTVEVFLVDRNNRTISNASTYSFDRFNEVEEIQDLSLLVLDPRFQESMTDDSVRFYLASLLPISAHAESKMILQTLKEKNTELSRKYIQQFWVQTSPTTPTDAWLSYKSQVMLTQKLYANNFQDGYETDRGRVYLQYGQPNSIIQKESSPTEYPYEIWHYYRIRNYSNRRFIFYNPDLVNNAYRLLHSDMIGELKNTKWQEALVLRNTPGSGAGESDLEDNFGGNSNYYYRQY